MIEFVGPSGEELTLAEWEVLFGRRTEDMSPESWWRKWTVVDGIVVSTVWIGLPIGPLDNQYGAWETMVQGGDDDGWMQKYATRQEAFDDHERIVREFRAGIKAGTLSLSEALHDPRALPIEARDLLVCVPLWGRKKSQVALKHLMISEHRRVRELTAREIALIAGLAGGGR